jgi:hypothetical protein
VRSGQEASSAHVNQDRKPSRADGKASRADGKATGRRIARCGITIYLSAERAVVGKAWSGRAKTETLDMAWW